MGKNTDLRFLTFNKYIREPVKEYPHLGWVLNGKENSHYQYIIDRYYGSTTNSTSINSIIDLVYGKGITIKGLDQESQQVKDFHKLLSKKDLKAIITDAVIFNELSTQVIRKNKGTLSSLKHIDKYKVVPSIEDVDGTISSYWFSRDWKNQWKQVRGVRIAEPVEYPAFPLGEKGETELFVSKPYRVGKEYFPEPTYLAGLPYAEFEEEVANYYLKYIKNGLSLGNIINVPNSSNWSDEEKTDFVKSVKQDHTGSEKANSLIVAFSGGDEPTTIESIKNDYAHKQWDFLTQESRQQLLTAHRITSPSLVGVISSSGFSSTADEMDEAEHQFMKRVISPIQNFVIDSLREVLEYFGEDLDLLFVPLTEKEENKNGAIIEKDSNEVEEEVALSLQCNCDKKKSQFDFINEYALDEPKDYDLYQTDFNLDEDFVELRADANSEQDTKKWKIRYAYNIGTSKSAKGGSRDFCNKMMSLANSGKVFRKEDIDKMSSDGVNGQFAHSGGKYDIFLYGGGVNCYHRWERRIYKKKTQKNGDLFGGNALQNTFPLNVNEARRQGAKLPRNAKDVAIAEIDKPNKGRYPS
jgi:hypothetical protein